METQLFNMGLKEGIFAAMFLGLLIWVMKNNTAREKSYQETIISNQVVITEQAKAFASLSKDVAEIKQILVDDKGNAK